MNEKPDRKPRVLLVATSMRVIGGQSVQAKALLDALRVDGRVEAGFLPNNPELRRLGFLQRIFGLRTIATSLRFWRMLLAEVRDYDIIHVYSSSGTGYVIATLPPLVAAKLFRKRAVLNYHSGAAREHVKRWKPVATPTMRMFDRIVVPSGFLADAFAGFGLSAAVVSNFLDARRFSRRERDPLRPVFLCNRNFESHYNVDCVLRAFELIRKEIPEATLTVAGSGPEERPLRRLAAELGLENVRFVGRLDAEEMARAYDEADIYLNASLVDNMPLSILEAFAAGLPVVSSDAGGIPYIVEDGRTGLLVPMNDCGALASAALKLLADPELAKQLIANARTESQRYSTGRIVEDWISFYTETMRGSA